MTKLTALIPTWSHMVRTSRLLTVLVTCYIPVLWWKKRQERSKLPPGPRGWPLFGNFFSIDFKNPTEKFTEWAHEFGGIFTLNILGQNIVVVSTKETITEVLVTKSEDFANRLYMYRMMEVHRHHQHILSSKVSPTWRILKRTSVMALKMCGEGFPRFEEITNDIIEDLLSNLNKRIGETFDIFPDIHCSVAEVISSLIYGSRSDEKLIRELIEFDLQLRETLSPAGIRSKLDAFPLLRYIPFYPSTMRVNMLRDHAWMWVADRSQLEQKVGESYSNADGAPRTLKKHPKHKFRKMMFNDDVIDAVGIDVLMAGMLTTSVAMYSLILLLIKNPAIQRRAQREIDDFIGSRTASLKDRRYCHYVEAMLVELLRYTSHGPFGRPIPHETTKDTSIFKHDIPKGTQVWADLFTHHHDPALWTNPWEFRPDRFLDENGEFIAPDHPLRKQWFPFGAGRSSCLGEHLTMNRLFLFTSALLQRFRFFSSDDVTLPSLDPRDFKFGIVSSPDKYLMKLSIRD